MGEVVFFNIGWMDKDQGVHAGDTPVHGGSFVGQHGFGAEIFNFQRFQSKMYGFVEAGWRPVPKCIRITRLGARRTDQSASGILVIWVARHPDDKKTLVVGWYENAKVYKERQTPPPNSPRKDPYGDDAPYFAESEWRDCLLIPQDRRDFQILRAAELEAAAPPPSGLRNPGGIGQSNIYYGQDWYGNQIKPKALQYVAMWKAQKHLSVPL